jgi:hypothetical protein
MNVRGPHHTSSRGNIGSQWQSRARALMCLSKGIVCRRRLLLFLLAGLLLCLLRFLSHVALRDPKVGSMQVDLDMHKYRVHHNCKIDTAWLFHDASTRYVDTA